MKRAVIEALTLQQRYDELPKALSKTLDRYLKGTGVVGAELTLALPKLDKDGKPMDCGCKDKQRKEGMIPDGVKIALGRLVDNMDTKDANNALDMLENFAINNPMIEKNPEVGRKVKRMFEIRKEMHELEMKQEKLIEELKAL